MDKEIINLIWPYDEIVDYKTITIKNQYLRETPKEYIQNVTNELNKINCDFVYIPENSMKVLVTKHDTYTFLSYYKIKKHFSSKLKLWFM